MKKYALATMLLFACPAYAAVSSQSLLLEEKPEPPLPECLRATQVYNYEVEQARQFIVEKVSDIADLNSRIMREPPEEFVEILLSGGYIDEAMKVGPYLLHYKGAMNEKCAFDAHATHQQ